MILSRSHRIRVAYRSRFNFVDTNRFLVSFQAGSFFVLLICINQGFSVCQTNQQTCWFSLQVLYHNQRGQMSKARPKG